MEKKKRKRRDERRPESQYPNLIKSICPIRSGFVLVGDFTHIIYQLKVVVVVYVATFMDLFTREIVGWSISNRHTKEFVLEAFLDAIKNLDKLPGIVHTDQGSEYCSKEYIGFLEGLGIRISMSKKASPWENGYQESYYNRDRIQTRLKMSPEQFKILNGG